MNSLKEIEFNNSLIDFYTKYRSYANEFIKWNTCTNCNLCNTREKTVFASGDPISSLVTIIGEAPGPEENKVGIPFIGKTGKFLRDVLDKVGLPAEKLFWTNSVACEPKDFINGQFRAPTSTEISACQPRLKWLFDNVITNHKVIIILGKPAFISVKSFVENYNQNDIDILSKSFKVSDNLGWHKLSDKLPVCYFTFHPSYIERSGREKLITQSWIDDFKCIKKYLNDNIMEVHSNRKVIEHAKR